MSTCAPSLGAHTAWHVGRACVSSPTSQSLSFKAHTPLPKIEPPGSAVPQPGHRRPFTPTCPHRLPDNLVLTGRRTAPSKGRPRPVPKRRNGLQLRSGLHSLASRDRSFLSPMTSSLGRRCTPARSFPAFVTDCCLSRARGVPRPEARRGDRRRPRWAPGLSERRRAWIGRWVSRPRRLPQAGRDSGQRLPRHAGRPTRDVHRTLPATRPTAAVNARPPAVSTRGCRIPATTWAFVTTTPRDATQPEPSTPSPHAMPVTRTTLFDACTTSASTATPLSGGATIAGGPTVIGSASRRRR